MPSLISRRLEAFTCLSLSAIFGVALVARANDGGAARRETSSPVAARTFASKFERPTTIPHPEDNAFTPAREDARAGALLRSAPVGLRLDLLRVVPQPGPRVG